MNKIIISIIISMILLNSTQIILADNPENNNLHSVKNKELKILSWNIYMLPYISLFNNNAIRARTIAEKLKNSDYQIIVFQEAFSSKCRNILSRKLRAKYPYQYGPANYNFLPLRTNSGLWVVSKIPLTMLNQIQFKQRKGFDAVARKGAVLFEGNFNGYDFQLLATHLQADLEHSIRDKQCLEIKEHLLNKFNKKLIPQFICGDFNIEMDDSQNYKKMLKTLDAQNGDLTGNVQVTYDEINNDLAKIPNGKSKIIDYVLIRNAERLINVERKIQTFFTQIGERKLFLSDHYAMEFSVNFGQRIEKQTAQLSY